MCKNRVKNTTLAHLKTVPYSNQALKCIKTPIFDNMHEFKHIWNDKILYAPGEARTHNLRIA